MIAFNQLLLEGSKNTRATISSINKELKKRGWPIELQKGTGYFYYVWDDGDYFTTETISGVYKITALSFEQWIKEAEDFGNKMKKHLGKK